MNELSTPNPQPTTPETNYNCLHFKPEIDRVTDWRIHNIPWQRVSLATLHVRDEFMPGSSYGRNLWDELYKGETTRRLYVPLPETLITTYNVLVEYNGQSMVVLQHAQPDFAKPRKMNQVEMMYYYRWMGRS